MSEFVRPLAGSPTISRSFARHVEQKSVNPGVDYAVATGTPVYSPAAGKVAKDDDNPGGAAGISVVIYHDNGWSSDLLHLSRNVVVAGQRVAQGQLVGYSGNTGASTGPHLHWSLRPKQINYYANVGNVNGESKIGPANPWSDYKAVQTRLNVWRKYWKLPLLVVDGIFGANSRAALLDFQKRKGLVQDGKLGPASWAAMILNPPVPTPPVVPEPPVVEPEPEPEVPVVPEPEVPLTPEPEVPIEKPGEETPTWFTRFLAAILDAILAFLGRK